MHGQGMCGMRGQATVLYSMCGRQVIQGLCGALDTLASQVCKVESPLPVIAVCRARDAPAWCSQHFGRQNGKPAPLTLKASWHAACSGLHMTSGQAAPSHSSSCSAA